MTNDEVSDWLYRIRSKTEVFMSEAQNTKAKEAVATAIKALEQKPCEDCVSRQAVLDAITKIHPVDTEYDCTLYDKLDVMYVMKELPPVTPQPTRWIPVTEKLPAENGFYICTVKEVHYYVKEPLGMPIEHDVTYRVEELNYMRGSWNVHRGHVIAWMPLPSPYKAESEEWYADSD